MKPDPTAARRTRSERAAVYAKLESGTLTLNGLLGSSRGAQKALHTLAGADLWDILLRCPGVGRSRARDICERAHVWPHTQLGSLTSWERAAILETIDWLNAPAGP